MTVRERPFISHLPLIGQGVAWLRTLWNNVAARYYLQALLQQQNELNRRVTIYPNQHQEKLKQQNNSGLSMSQTVTKLQAQLSEIDQQVRALKHASPGLRPGNKYRCLPQLLLLLLCWQIPF